MKSIATFHAMDSERLSELPTRLLLAALAGSRGQILCSCGSRDCFDGLDKDQEAWNASQDALNERLRAILATREHVEPRPGAARRREKKAMAY